MKKSIKILIICLISLAIGLLIGIIIDDLISGIFAGLTGIGIIIINVFNQTPNNEKVIKEEIDKLTSDEIRSKIQYNKEFQNYGESLIVKRKELTSGEKILGEINSILYSSLILIIIGLFYLGAMPVYFGVNNEFINPTNSSIGLNQSINLVGNAGIIIITNLMQSGAENPFIFFWLFWIGVLFIFIIPIIKVAYYIIKDIVKGGKNGNRRY